MAAENPKKGGCKTRHYNRFTQSKPLQKITFDKLLITDNAV